MTETATPVLDQREETRKKEIGNSFDLLFKDIPDLVHEPEAAKPELIATEQFSPLPPELTNIVEPAQTEPLTTTTSEIAPTSGALQPTHEIPGVLDSLIAAHYKPDERTPFDGGDTRPLKESEVPEHVYTSIENLVQATRTDIPIADRDTQPLDRNEVSQNHEVTVETRAFGGEKPVSPSDSSENKFVNYVGIKTEKETGSVTGREILRTEQFTVIRTDAGEYRVNYKNGVQALALKNGNKLIVTIMPVCKGARSAGSEYQVYRVKLEPQSLEQEEQDFIHEIQTRQKMGEYMLRTTQRAIKPLLPYADMNYSPTGVWGGIKNLFGL